MKLEVKNDWTYQTYFLDGKKINERKGGTATVRWPNGNADSEVPFQSVKVSASYGDMGRTISTHFYSLIAYIDHNGVMLTTDLAGLDIVEIKQDV